MTDHIAGGIDVRHCGLVGFAVNFDPAAVVGFKPHRLEIEMRGRAQTAGCKKQHFSAHMAAVFQGDLHMVGAGLNAFNFRSQPQINTVFADLMGKLVDGVAVDKIKKGLARFNQSDPHIQRGKHGGIFHPNDAGANHNQAARNLRHLQKVIAVNNAASVERHPVGAKGTGAGCNEEFITGDFGFLTRLGGHLKLVVAHKTRCAQ